MNVPALLPLRPLRVLAAALLLPCGAGAAPADAILGAWLTDDGASKVQVTADKAPGGATVYAGKVVWLKQPERDGQPLRDANNEDAALRGRPILGLTVLSGFSFADGVYRGGSVYSPRAGKAYPAELAVGADGRLELKVKAGLISKTDHWTR